MSSVDNRVVSMKFDNEQFQQGVSKTMTSLESLNKALKLEGATKGFDDLNNAGNKVQLGHIATAIDSIADKFHTLSIIGITALTNIVNKAVTAGTSLLHSLTIGPILDGYHEYETNLNSIQTILANTGLTGEAGLKKVTDALNVLNKYSDQTIYNFSEMARNIGTFTAAGVTLDVATQAIKGIANLAAISGSSAEQASTAMYQLSQAISAGKVTLEDWNSVVNAGMGGKVFQNALMETARVHGVAIDKMVKDAGSFRLTLENGWLTGQILTETLSKFTGDLTAAQLKTMGYNDKQIAQILVMAKTAQDAATKVKTFSQLINTLQEAVGSGWANTWQILFGDFDEARSLFTDINVVLGGFISKSAETRNSVLADWKLMGGRTVLIEAISNAFHALIAVVTPIKQAFRQIFPATTARELFDLTNTLRDFTKGLLISGETADKIQHTFAGVFAIFSIGWDIVKGLATVLAHLFGMVGGGAGSFLDVTASVGDFLVNMKLAIESGNGLTRFFQNVEKVLAVPIRLLQMAAEAIGNLFSKFDGDAAAQKFTGVVGKLSPITHILDVMINTWSKLPEAVSHAWQIMEPFAKKIGGFFSGLGETISNAFKGINFTAVFEGIATGGFTALLLTIAGFIRKLKGGIDGGGIIEAITAPFEELTKTLQTMQTTLRAATLLEIAAAIAILAIAVVALSKVNAEGLTRALTAIAIMFGQLAGALYAFEKIASDKDIAKMIALGAALILLATAVDILASAVTKLAQLNWNELAKGLTGVTVILGALVGTVQLMPNEGKLIGTSAALVVLAAAVKILVSAVTDLAGLSWQELAKGLTSVGILLGSLILFTRFAEADKGGVLQGAGLLLLAAGIKVLASALGDLSKLSWSEIARGLAAMAGGLVLMAGALYLLPPSSILSAAAILVVAASLGLIGDAIKDMGKMKNDEIAKGLIVLAGALTYIAAALLLIPPSSLLSAAAVFVVAASLSMIGDALKDMAKMSWEEIVKSLVELAGALAIIAGAMYLMEGALPGAAALIVVAASLAILAPVLQMFGQMSWEEMGKGLLMLAGVFLVLGVAGAVLTPVVPTLIGLGLAVTLLGVGLLAAGVGLLAFSIALTALSIAGVAGTAALVGMVAAIAGLIPQVMVQVGLGLVAFAQVIATAGPAITGAMVTVLLALLNAIETTSPKIISTLSNLMERMLEAMVKNVPKMTDAGLKILIGFLNGIAKNMGGVVTAAVNVVVAFINGIASNTGKVVQAGINLIISYINALADGIRNNQDRMNAAGRNLASAIIEGMASGLLGGAGKIASIARDVAKKALDAAKSFLGINSPSKEFMKVGMGVNEGFADGLTGYSSLTEKAATGVAKTALEAAGTTLSKIGDVLDANLDINPTITPVLDLSSVRNDAAQLAGILAAKPIPLNSSYSQAKDASGGYQSNQDTAMANDASNHSETTVFNQYNNSPKALSSAEIYRQTKNQLSKAKGVVTP